MNHKGAVKSQSFQRGSLKYAFKFKPHILVLEGKPHQWCKGPSLLLLSFFQPLPHSPFNTPPPVFVLRWEHGLHIWRWSCLACGKGCQVKDTLHSVCICEPVCLQGVMWSWLPNAPDYKQLAGPGINQSDMLLVVTSCGGRHQCVTFTLGFSLRSKEHNSAMWIQHVQNGHNIHIF